MESRKKLVDEKYCFECGEIIREKAEICPKCGCRQPGGTPSIPTDSTEKKSRTTAAALAIVLGGIGAHKFYLGKPIQGIVYAAFLIILIPAFLGLIEGIRYLMMSDSEFQTRYKTGTLDNLGKPKAPSSANPDTHVKCPDCRELILREARKCKHCGCMLIPQ